MAFFLLLFLVGITAIQAQTTVPEWRSHTPLPAALTGHRAALLPNGDVLVAGGITADGQASATSLVYSARTGAFAPTLNAMSVARAYHALVAVATPQGDRVFAIGGYTGAAAAYRSTASVEVLEFDAAQQNWRWRTVGTLRDTRGDCAAAWDGGRFIVVAGGRQQNAGALHAGTPMATAERIDVQTLQITSIGAMATARSEHALVLMLDQQNNQQLLVAGGEISTPTTSTELLPQAATAWDPRANPPIAYRSAAASVGDISGIARVFGGFDANGSPLSTCEWYDSKSGWRAAPRMQDARARTGVSLVASHTDTAAAYLVAGGRGSNTPLNSAEVFFLPNNTSPNGEWTPFPPLNQRGAERALTITGSNLALVMGGDDAAPLQHTEIFQPLRANDVAFGQEEVGRTSDSLPIVLKNEWLLPVRVDQFRFAGSAEFLLASDITTLTIPAGAQRVVYARFRPNAAGERTGKLLFAVGALTDTVQLRGTGVASELAVAYETVDFDSVFVRTAKRLCFAALYNKGKDTTVIDSVVIAPASVYRLVSPTGRVAVPPGDSLMVCIEFQPDQRGSAIAAATVHVAARAFPLALTGTGIRRFATATASTDCDTVTIAPGNSLTRFVTVSNPSDKPVTITQVNFTASANDLFALADAAILPLVLAPGDVQQVEILFTPQREATERVAITFANDGDTASATSLCFVLRSRFVAASRSTVDFGSVCVGDTASVSLLLENPGQFEAVLVNTVAMASTASIAVRSATDTTLPPHGYMVVQLSFAPQTAGVVNDTLVALGSFGRFAVPVRGNARPSLTFAPQQTATSPAETTVLPVHVQGMASTPVSVAQLTVAYNRTLLYPHRIVPLASGPPIDVTASRIAIVSPGIAQIHVVWQTPLMLNGAAFGIECEVLRGNSERTTVSISGNDNAEFCVLEASDVVLVTGPCGGEAGLLRTEATAFVQVTPNPTSDNVQLLLYTEREAECRVVLTDSFGQPVQEYKQMLPAKQSTRTSCDVRSLPTGVYFVRTFLNSTIVDVQPVMIIR